VTLTLIVQLLFAATVPFENEREPAPATGAKVGAPQPLVVAAGGLATTIAPGEVGKVSVKLRPESGAPLGLMMVKVSDETPPTLVGWGLKFFLRVTVDGSRIEAMRVEVLKSSL